MSRLERVALAGWLATLLAICSYALGGPLVFAVGGFSLAMLLLLIDIELVSRYPKQSRRRPIVWAVLATSAAAIGPQAAPLLPPLLLACFIYLRATRPP